MQQMPPVSRTGHASRAARRATPQPPQPPQKKRKNKKPAWFPLLLTIAAVLAIIAVSPKEPVTRAFHTTATEDGIVNRNAGTKDPYYEGLVISELMSSNTAAVPDETGVYHDWLEVWNSSDHAIDMKDVGLSDRTDSIRFLFPAMTLPADGRVIVFCSDTNAANAGETLHAKFKLSSVGETVSLFDPNAYLLHSVTTPIMGGDESWALLEDGTYAATKDFSPGYPNTTEGYQAYQTATMVMAGDLIINEIMPDPITGLRDSDDMLCDWIELYNTTDQPISLDNYALSDKEDKALAWRFPAGAVVPPKSYYVVFCTGKEGIDAASGVPHASFKLSAEHDVVVLSDSHGRLVDRVVIDNIPEDCSYGRLEDGSFGVFNLATPGLPNSEAGAHQMDYNLRMMNPTGVYITEVMASNDSTVIYQGLKCTDWVELFNSSSETVDLSGYGLSDTIGRARKWQFPEGTFISPGEHKIILCDGKSELSTTAQLHTSYKILRAGGETVCLSDPTGRVLDKMVLPLIPTDVSYGRTVGLAGFFYYDAPTPMQANGYGFVGYAEAPQLTVEPGLHYDTVYTGFTVPENTTVHYTVDGSEPTQNSAIYNGETIELNFTTVLRARAFAHDGKEPSTITTGTYFINAYHSLPIVSLTVDPDDLWNEEYGILAPGPNVDKTKFPFKNTVYRKVKDDPNMPDKVGHVEYYLLDGTQVLSQGVGVSLQGQYSLDMPQKTFKLRAKSLYGAKYFDAKLFEDREFVQYKSIVLRNSGNDCVWTRLLDGFQSRLLDGYGSTVIHQAWNPIVVYLNGTYWGHYNMRERVDRFFIAQHEGLPLDEADQMDIVEANGSTKYGSNKEYKAMIKKIKAGNPAKNPEDLQYILDNVDVENYFEYMALEMFVGNSDPGNIRYYKLKKPGAKWKWIFYDVDYGLFNSGFNSPKSYTKAKGMGDQLIDNTIFLKLLSVPEYKDMFLRKLGDIYQTFTTEYLLSVLEPMVAQIKPEMQLHWARWGEENDPAIIAEAPASADGAYRYWEQRIDRLRNTCKKRPNLLWGFIQDAFELSQAQMEDYFGPRPDMPSDAY